AGCQRAARCGRSGVRRCASRRLPSQSLRTPQVEEGDARVDVGEEGRGNRVAARCARCDDRLPPVRVGPLVAPGDERRRACRRRVCRQEGRSVLEEGARRVPLSRPGGRFGWRAAPRAERREAGGYVPAVRETRRVLSRTGAGAAPQRSRGMLGDRCSQWQVSVTGRKGGGKRRSGGGLRGRGGVCGARPEGKRSRDVPAAAPAPDLSNFLAPAGPPADAIRTISLLVLAITGVIFLLVGGLLAYSCVRYRSRPGDDD